MSVAAEWRPHRGGRDARAEGAEPVSERRARPLCDPDARNRQERFVLARGRSASPVHTRQTLFGPTLPIYEAYNPAIAQVDAEHVFSVAEFDVMKNGMAPEAAIDKALKRAEEVFAKYPIAQA